MGVETLVGLAAASLAGSLYSSHQQARAQEKATKSQERANRLALQQQEEADAKAEQQENKANKATVNNYDETATNSSASSGLLSGGVNKGSLTLGKNNSLGYLDNDGFF